MLGILAFMPEEQKKIQEFPHWNNIKFVLSFLLSSIMGSVVNYSIFVCTTVNSALTTAVVGCFKNVFTTYLGMIYLPDYIFSISNFVGLNISIMGSIVYSVAELQDQAAKTVGAQKASSNIIIAIAVVLIALSTNGLARFLPFFLWICGGHREAIAPTGVNLMISIMRPNLCSAWRRPTPSGFTKCERVGLTVVDCNPITA